MKVCSSALTSDVTSEKNGEARRSSPAEAGSNQGNSLSEEANFGHCYGQVSSVFSHLPFSFQGVLPCSSSALWAPPLCRGCVWARGREQSSRPQTMENTAPLWRAQTWSWIQWPDGTRAHPLRDGASLFHATVGRRWVGIWRTGGGQWWRLWVLSIIYPFPNFTDGISFL